MSMFLCLLCSLLEEHSTLTVLKFCLNKIIIACINMNCGYISFMHARSGWGFKGSILFIVYVLLRKHFTKKKS